MSFSISEGIKNTFDLATQRQKISRFRNSTDWEKGMKIIKRYKQETQRQERLYYSEYEGRFNRALKSLIDKAGSKKKTFTHRLFGSDNFNKDALKKLAHRHVQQDHERRASRLEERELSELNVLNDTIEQRDRLFDKPKQEFNRTVDRRRNHKQQQNHPKRTRQ